MQGSFTLIVLLNKGEKIELILFPLFDFTLMDVYISTWVK